MFSFALGAALMLFPSDTRGADVEKREYNIILVSATNTRADHLGLYGYQRNTSPNIDRFARKSVVFRNAFSHASWTLPVAVSLFTSQYPFTHGLMNREEEPILAPEVPTFVDVLKMAGYKTAAFVGDRDYSAKYGHTARFDHVFDAVTDPEREEWKSYGVFGNTLPPAREWLRKNKDEKFLLLVQGYDTHCPFATPKPNTLFSQDYRGSVDFTKCYWTFEPTRPIRRRTDAGQYEDVFLLKTRPTDGDQFELRFYPDDVRQMIALYDGEIYNVDEMLGGLFADIEELGLLKNTIVIFYSDHGDMFGKHGRFMRGGPLRGTFYDDVLHVPLVMYHPALEARSVDGLVQVVDIAPTLLDLLGLKSPASFRGKSAVPLLGGQSAIQSHVFAGSAFKPSDRNPFFKHPSVIVSARSHDWKLIAERLTYATGPRDSFELYDLRKDSEELRNVATSEKSALDGMKSALRRWLESIDATRIFNGL